MRMVRCANCRTENVAAVQFCHHCGRPPQQGMPSTRPPGEEIAVDHDKMQARRAQVSSAMDGRPGQVRRAKLAKDFDAFVHTRSEGRFGWESAAPDEVFGRFWLLDPRGNGTTSYCGARPCVSRGWLRQCGHLWAWVAMYAATCRGVAPGKLLLETEDRAPRRTRVWGALEPCRPIGNPVRFAACRAVPHICLRRAEAGRHTGQAGSPLWRTRSPPC